MITFAKGVTSGYLPLGGVVAHGRVAEPFWSRPGNTLGRGSTYAGHPAACAAGLVNIDLLEREELIERGQAMEGTLAGALNPLASHELVADVRAGLGLLGAVELTPDVLERRPSAVTDLHLLVRQHGVVTRTLAKALAVSPPLTIEPEQIHQIGAALAAGLDDLALKL